MTPPKKLVLLIEDDKEIRETLCDLLTDEGFNIASAENGLKALQFLRTEFVLPSIILLDISMPVMGGFEFRKFQLKEEKLARIPTIMLSADANMKDKAAEVGVTQFMRKPIELNELLATLKQYT